jgi:hypothetical protein
MASMQEGLFWGLSIFRVLVLFVDESELSESTLLDNSDAELLAGSEGECSESTLSIIIM